MAFKLSRTNFSLFFISTLLVSLSSNSAFATNEQSITIEVRKEVERLLNDSQFMEPIIERGINRFILNQQSQAEAEKQRAQAAKMKNMRPVSIDYDHIYGDLEAPISLVEYSDFECPYCKRFHFSVHEFINNNKGKVNLVYRHYPLSFHNPAAQKEAEASECAAEQGGNESFWKYTDLIYLRTKAGGNGFPISNLIPLAEEIGLDKHSFEQCLNSGKMAKRVNADFTNGSAAGITGTPGNILIENKSGRAIFLNGALPLQKLNEALEQLSQ